MGMVMQLYGAVLCRAVRLDCIQDGSRMSSLLSVSKELVLPYFYSAVAPKNPAPKRTLGLERRWSVSPVPLPDLAMAGG